MYPIENHELLVETIKAALASGRGNIEFNAGATVASAVKAVIDADRAYRIYIRELSDKSRLGL